MSFQLRIEHTNGRTSTADIVNPDEIGRASAPSLVALRTDDRLAREPQEASTAEATVYRDAWADIQPDVDTLDDRVIIEDDSPIFGGRFRDIEVDGGRVSILLDGPKRDMLEAPPSGPDVSYPQQPDASIVQSILSRVPTITAGTVETVSEVAFRESFATAGASIARLAEITGAEPTYTPGFQLDYQGRRGSDRTTTLLSPVARNVIGGVRVREDSREDASDVVVLGGSDGDGRIRAEVSVRPSDRPAYKIIRDDSIASEVEAQRIAAREAEVLSTAPQSVVVELSVIPSVDPQVGDRFRVAAPEYGLPRRELRVVRRERIVDTEGEQFRLVLSNRDRGLSDS